MFKNYFNQKIKRMFETLQINLYSNKVDGLPGNKMI